MKDNFSKILEQNAFEVNELLRQSNIIAGRDETLQEQCFRAYQKEGKRFAFKLSEIIANNTNVSHLFTVDDNLGEVVTPSDTPTSATLDETAKQNRFEVILGNVTSILNTGIGAFGAWQQAKSARDMSNWQYQREYYDRINKEKQNRNILIITALVIIAIIIIVVVRKYN